MYKKFTRGYFLEIARSFMEEEGVSVAEFKQLLEMARQYHNPLNYDGGEEIAEKLGVNYLFDKAREKEGLGIYRFYFKFTEVDCTDFEEVARAFFNCENYGPYLKAWQKHAPEAIKSELFFLLSLITMTVKGFKREEEIIEKSSLIKSSFEEDYYQGIDAWTADGEPVQIKSAATERGMK